MRPINKMAICAVGIYLHSSYTTAQNLPPTDLSLDSPNISENSDVGTLLSKLDIEDPDFARIQKNHLWFAHFISPRQWSAMGDGTKYFGTAG